MFKSVQSIKSSLKINLWDSFGVWPLLFYWPAPLSHDYQGCVSLQQQKRLEVRLKFRTFTEFLLCVVIYSVFYSFASYDLFMLFFFTLKQEESAHIVTAVRLASFSALIFCAEEICITPRLLISCLSSIRRGSDWILFPLVVVM